MIQLDEQAQAQQRYFIAGAPENNAGGAATRAAMGAVIKTPFTMGGLGGHDVYGIFVHFVHIKWEGGFDDAYYSAMFFEN